MRLALFAVGYRDVRSLERVTCPRTFVRLLLPAQCSLCYFLRATFRFTIGSTIRRSKYVPNVVHGHFQEYMDSTGDRLLRHESQLLSSDSKASADAMKASGSYVEQLSFVFAFG